MVSLDLWLSSAILESIILPLRIPCVTKNCPTYPIKVHLVDKVLFFVASRYKEMQYFMRANTAQVKLSSNVNEV